MLKLKHSPPQQHTHAHSLTHTLLKLCFTFVLKSRAVCCWVSGLACERQSKYVTTHKAETAIAAVAGTTTTANLFCSLRKRSSSSAAAEGSPSRSAAVPAAAADSRHDSRVSLARVCVCVCSRDEQMLESKYRSQSRYAQVIVLAVIYLRGVC